MFAIELAAPFLLFGPRRLRLIGAGAIAALRWLILLTSNYGFFNYLTIALTLLCLDDETLTRRWPAARRWASAVVPPADRRSRWRRVLSGCGELGLCVLVMTVSGLQLAMMFTQR